LRNVQFGGEILREILISLGVILACGFMLVVVQLTSGNSSALAENLTTTQPAVVALDTNANPAVDETNLLQ
jgi:flagellar basal body-associated protein FliL